MHGQQNIKITAKYRTLRAHTEHKESLANKVSDDDRIIFCNSK